MRHSQHGRFRQQVNFLRRQFLQDGSLSLSHVLSEQLIAQALATIKVVWLDRIYSPLITLWVFLGQVLSADHSCRAAVARLIAHRISRGQSPCSAETGTYCQARKRLPEKFFSDVARQVGRGFRRYLYQQLLEAITIHRVADRPDRYEPRRKKRRPKPYARLMKPRLEAKRLMLNGFREK